MAPVTKQMWSIWASKDSLHKLSKSCECEVLPLLNRTVGHTVSEKRLHHLVWLRFKGFVWVWLGAPSCSNVFVYIISNNHPHGFRLRLETVCVVTGACSLCIRMQKFIKLSGFWTVSSTQVQNGVMWPNVHHKRRKHADRLLTADISLNTKIIKMWTVNLTELYWLSNRLL